MRERIPAETFGPGAIIREEMEARGWTSDDLTLRLRWRPAMTRAFLEDRYPITEWVARDLARVFGTSVELWLNMEKRR